jgi:hypothetical protein
LPTYERLPRFDADFERLSADEKKRFLEAVKKLVAHLEEPGGPSPGGLRIKGVQGAPGVFELTWAPNGRATFQFGKPIREGEAHVIWRRVGGHEVFGEP